MDAGNLRIAFDLDGIICRDATRFEKWLYKKNKKWVDYFQSHRKVIYRPPSEALIITGRPVIDATVTCLWMQRNKIYNPILLRPLTESELNHKAMIIKREGIAIYWESSKQMTKDLAEICSGTSVLYWGSEHYLP